MKNLFKNLMLVAVAAMAFTACTETGEEVNAVSKKVVLEFVADLADDDTRVAFGEKDGNKYPTVWEADDSVTVKVGDKQAWYTLTEEDILESGKKAIIRPEFELLEGETLSGDIVATVNESVYFDNHQGNKPTISLKAEAVYPATTLTFEHQYAYGKMELVGLPAEFDVTEVKLNLVGGGKELNHTIRGYSVEDNIFWFTTEAMETVESFAVYASNGAGTYYKEVTVEKDFAFEVGKISAFRVNDLVVKPADFNVQLTKITSMSDNVIRFEGDNAEDNITISFNPGLETLAAGHYDAVVQDWFNGGVWAWSSDSALEVKDEFEGSSVDVNAAGGGAWYYSHNGVDITVDGDVYTIVAHLQNYTQSGGNQTVDFTYVGKLEVAGSGSESDQPGEGGGDPSDFVIPGEGDVYDYDWRYSGLSYGLEEGGNDLRVLKDDNEWQWDIKFNTGLTEIVPGDYTPVKNYSSPDALECDTYMGGFQTGAYMFQYPADYGFNTKINVQKSGDIYCITLIDTINGAKYRLVYIGKIRKE